MKAWALCLYIVAIFVSTCKLICVFMFYGFVCCLDIFTHIEVTSASVFLFLCVYIYI